jgi:RNA polymerase-binding transcription factor DksA
MRGSDAALELAEQMAEQEREAGILRVRAALAVEGSEVCENCCQRIGIERRIAVPSACRCVDCQTRLERGYERRG